MLDEKLLFERLNQFKPEPLVDYEVDEERVIETSMISGNDSDIDLAKTNFLNVLDSEEIKKTAENCIREYGVGTCGPRAFYGTTEVHLNAEEVIAKFLGTEETIIYSYGFVAISSAIAAYCNRKDIVFIDQHANIAITQGLEAAKSQVVYFDHNDPESFRNVAKTIAEKEVKPRRKFLIIEGISWKTGSLCPLPKFVEVAEEFKMRIFLEESYTMGIFGKTGKGLIEHYDIPVEKVDMIFGTLEGAIGSIGGFCSGLHSVIEHQRLSGSGYIFSASLPTYLTQIVLKSIESLGDKPKKFLTFAEEFHKFLQKDCGFKVISDSKSPFKIFTTDSEENNIRVHEYCKGRGLHFIRNENGLLINLNINLAEEKEKLDKVYTILKHASEIQ